MRTDSKRVSIVLYSMHLTLAGLSAISFSIIKPIDRILNQHKNFIISRL